MNREQRRKLARKAIKREGLAVIAKRYGAPLDYLRGFTLSRKTSLVTAARAELEAAATQTEPKAVDG